MKQYHPAGKAPIQFHMFFWYVTLPFTVLLSIIFILIYTSQNTRLLDSFFPYASIFDVIYYALVSILSIICFVGFFRWKSYAWYSVIIILSTMVLYGFISGGIAGALILPYPILVGIYYIKRRPLFFAGIDRKDTTALLRDHEEIDENMQYHFASGGVTLNRTEVQADENSAENAANPAEAGGAARLLDGKKAGMGVCSLCGASQRAARNTCYHCEAMFT